MGNNRAYGAAIVAPFSYHQNSTMENSVVLIDYMGGDNLHAVNAWASTFLELGLELPDDIHARTDALTDAIQAQGARKRNAPDLLNYLAKNGHTSPFRASKLIYGMTIETATHTQLLTHTVAIEHTNPLPKHVS